LRGVGRNRLVTMTNLDPRLDDKKNGAKRGHCP